MEATTRLDLKQGLKVKMLVPNSDQCFLLNCCSLIIFWRAVNFRSFPAANPYPCALAGLFGLGAAILMGIGSHRIYTTDVGPDLKPFSSFPWCLQLIFSSPFSKIPPAAARIAAFLTNFSGSALLALLSSCGFYSVLPQTSFHWLKFVLKLSQGSRICPQGEACS